MTAYYPAAPGYGQAFVPRRTGDVFFEFYAHSSPHATPFPHPPELRSALSPEQWHERTVELWKHFMKWNWGAVQRIWLMVAILLSMIVPILSSTLVNHFKFQGLQPLTRDATDQEILDRREIIREAHLISFGITAGFLLVNWLPYFAYKALGRKKLTALLLRYNADDGAKGSMQALNWSLTRVSTYTKSAQVCVRLPPAYMNSVQPSNFDSSAYLPTYLAKDPSGAPGYPPQAQGFAPPQGPPPTGGYGPPAGPPPARDGYEQEMLGMGMERNEPNYSGNVTNKV